MKKYKEFFKDKGHIPTLGKKKISNWCYSQNKITKTYKSRKGKPMAEFVAIEFFEIQGNIFFPELREKITIKDGVLNVDYYDEEYKINIKALEVLEIGDTYIVPKKGYRYNNSSDYLEEIDGYYIKRPLKIKKLDNDNFLITSYEVDGDDEETKEEEVLEFDKLKQNFIDKHARKWTISVYENDELVDFITNKNYDE